MHQEYSVADERVAGMSGVIRFGGWRGEEPADGSPTDNMPTEDLAPRFDVETTDFGFQYAAIRDSVDGPSRKYVRGTAIMFLERVAEVLAGQCLMWQSRSTSHVACSVSP
jgi:hypothetical protein